MKHAVDYEYLRLKTMLNDRGVNTGPTVQCRTVATAEVAPAPAAIAPPVRVAPATTSLAPPAPVAPATTRVSSPPPVPLPLLQRQPPFEYAGQVSCWDPNHLIRGDEPTVYLPCPIFDLLIFVILIRYLRIFKHLEEIKNNLINCMLYFLVICTLCKTSRDLSKFGIYAMPYLCMVSTFPCSNLRLSSRIRSRSSPLRSLCQ